MRRPAAPLAGVALACAVAGASAAQPPAAAPAAPAAHFGASNVPIDISADSQELFQQERRLVYKGSVEAIQGQTRVRTPLMTIFYAPKPGAPGAPPAAPAAAGNTGFGAIQKIEAEGPVYVVTPTQSAKGDHGTFDAASDTITLTGNVTLLQDKNVSAGDKVVLEQKTGHAVMSMNAPTGRVRGVFYSQQAPAASPPPAAAPAPKR